MVVKKTGKPVPPAAVENMFQVDQSDGKFHPQSETAGIFVGGIFISPAAELCEKPKRNLQKYFQEIILYEDKKIDNAYKNPQDRDPAEKCQEQCHHTVNIDNDTAEPFHTIAQKTEAAVPVLQMSHLMGKDPFYLFFGKFIQQTFRDGDMVSADCPGIIIICFRRIKTEIG